MNKTNILYGFIGLFVGLIIGFWFANSVNQGAVAAVPPALTADSNIPPGHPDISGGGTQAAMGPEVQSAIENAKNLPTDFDAQLKAAEMYYQISRFDEAIEFLKAANKLRPDNHEVIVHLGNAHFDSDRYDEAENWYSAALVMKADDINVRTDLGLTFVFRDPPDYDRAIQEFNRSLSVDPNHIQTLQNLTVAYTKKGDTPRAKETLGRLESVDPGNTAVARLREDIAKMDVK